MAPPRPRVRCRQIEDADLESVYDLLIKSGFFDDRTFWLRALRRLSEHTPPPGYPKYGFLLEVNGVPVGMLLLISALIPGDAGPRVRCNVSCWYVWPAFRAYGSLLVSQALRYKEATYINISPLQHTFDLLAAQGYTRYCEGVFTCVPALTPRWSTASIAFVSPETAPGPDLPEAEVALLHDHVHYGCLSLVVTAGGRRQPFVFDVRWQFGVIGVATLIYCRSVDAFVAVAGPIGRFLARRGFFLVVIDANGPIRGLVGRYSTATPKYFKGPERPRLGDLAYSERAVINLQLPPRVQPEL
jgi:hypothetical protein